MSERARMVLRVIDYGEYVTAWAPIPITERPKWTVRKIDGEWAASPLSFVVAKFGLDGKREHWMPGNRRRGTGPREKRPFDSQTEAQTFTDASNWPQADVYQCSICGKWHLSKPRRR